MGSIVDQMGKAVNSKVKLWKFANSALLSNFTVITFDNIHKVWISSAVSPSKSVKLKLSHQQWESNESDKTERLIKALDEWPRHVCTCLSFWIIQRACISEADCEAVWIASWSSINVPTLRAYHEATDTRMPLSFTCFLSCSGWLAERLWL